MDITIIIDPLGNEVHLPLNFDEALECEDWMDESLSLTISKPAMIIMPTEKVKYLYHLRSVGWGITILLKSEWKETHWLVSEHIHNPEMYVVGELLQWGNGLTFNQE